MGNNIEIPEPKLPSRLQRDGYAWTEQSIEQTSKMLSDVLKDIKAKCWTIDVYTSAGQLYRSIAIRYALNGRIQDLEITYNVENPSMVTIK